MGFFSQIGYILDKFNKKIKQQIKLPEAFSFCF